MKIKATFCAVAVLAVAFAATASAQARNYIPRTTTVQSLCDLAEVIVVARLDRVEDVQLDVVGPDAQRWPRRHEGRLQDGEDFVRRDGILAVEQVLKGNAGAELRFVSMRQLRLPAYMENLRTEPAVWYLARRPGDNRLIPIMDERGTFSVSDVNGNFSEAVDFVRDHLAGKVGIDRMLDAIDMKGGRLSVDCALELSWNFDKFEDIITEEQRQRIVSMAHASPVGSKERNELITAIGRYKPEGGLNALFSIMLTDHSWPTSSLASWCLMEIDRRGAIARLLDEWDNAGDDVGRRTVIVRVLGQMRPKADFDGPELRSRALEIVGSVFVASEDKNLMREGMIASRNMSPEQEHVEALKKLIDERDTNGLTEAEIKGAIVALAAARKTVVGTTGIQQAVYARAYLENLAEVDPFWEQVISPALKFPWVILIEGADGRGH
jgi:hypothetical protein